MAQTLDRFAASGLNWAQADDLNAEAGDEVDILVGSYLRWAVVEEVVAPGSRLGHLAPPMITTT